jgi:4-methylaminobutanoate oxidase (formaldehyde-forming)
VGPTDDPFSAGLGHVVELEKDDVVGIEAAREAAARPPARRLVSVLLDDPEPVMFHGESIRSAVRIVGTVMSAAYAHTLGAAAGLAWVEAGVLEDGGATVEVDVAGDALKATLSTVARYDPSGSRMRA